MENNRQVMGATTSSEKTLFHKWGTRHTFILLSFFLMMMNQCWRINLSVAIVAMVSNKPSAINETSVTIGQECPFYEEPNDSNVSSTNTGEFDWDAQQQGLVLGAFFYGFIFTMLPGGYLAEKYSSKHVILISALGATLCSFLSPLSAKYGGYIGFMIIKIIQGVLQGPIIPAVTVMMSSWIPPTERSFACSLIYGGQQLGSVISFSLSGFLADQFGWEWDFYFFACTGVAFCLFWTLFVSSSPSDHPSISLEEKEMIEAELTLKSLNVSIPSPPYKSILLSKPFWALVLTYICSYWGFYTLLTNVPTYLNNIQHIPLTLNGLASSLPYLLNWIYSIVISWVADWLIQSKTLSRGQTRKLMTFIGFMGPAIALTSISLIGCSSTWAVALLCIAVMLEGTGYPGYNVNELELSPNYAGTLKGATGTIANICGFITPALVGFLTDEHQTIKAWNNVFYLSSAIYVLGTAIFVFFAKTSVQPWNTYWETQEDASEEKPALLP